MQDTGETQGDTCVQGKASNPNWGERWLRRLHKGHDTCPESKDSLGRYRIEETKYKVMMNILQTLRISQLRKREIKMSLKNQKISLKLLVRETQIKTVMKVIHCQGLAGGGKDSDC